jgi:hypothetical protein
VTCATRAAASKRTASPRTWRPSRRRARSLEGGGEILHRAPAGGEQFADLAVALAVGGAAVRRAALVDLAQAVLQRLDEQAPTARVLEQVVLEVGVALHGPDVAEHLVEHARGAAGAALAAQFVEQRPRIGAEQPDDDLAVGVRGVVVGDLADARRGALRRGEQRQIGGEGVHLGCAVGASGQGVGLGRHPCRRPHSPTVPL